MKNTNDWDIQEKNSIYSSMTTESLLEMLRTLEASSSEKRWNTTWGERTQRIWETIRLELTTRRDSAKALALKFASLAQNILDKNESLRYLEEKNNNNWSVWNDVAIGDLKSGISEIERERSSIEEMLIKLWFWTSVEVIESIKIVSETRQRVSAQLELPLQN
ncbi:MAG: hypothetical protein ACD_2C00049G0004 [uncultured bacterium (gcode 4)]|uniref:Uncharacterized protein n=1 Tax=uncultured bacterium (gcode 4) TaxID=1234023 RepID=K2FG02_9BACT|nr:MAG: hypothetical protein ACD_2C00049G0004 [uncultured bacterium (gcode 4)]